MGKDGGSGEMYNLAFNTTVTAGERRGGGEKCTPGSQKLLLPKP